MKKTICFIMTLALLLCVIPLSASVVAAADNSGTRLTSTNARPYAERVLRYYDGLADQAALDALAAATNDLSETDYNAPNKINRAADAIDTVVQSAKTHELYNIQLMSDVHMAPRGSAEESRYGDTQQAFEDAMRFSLELFPDTKGLIVAGDVTNFGHENEHARYLDAISNSEIPFIFTAIGNHEYNGYWDDPETARKNFLTSINKYYSKKGFPLAENVYYDTYIEGTHVIALGSEGAPKRTGGDDTTSDTKATISDAQIKWFKSKLAETEPDEPVFVVLHQPLENTHRLSDEWGVGAKDAELKSILTNYPQAILISGHLHNGYIGDPAFFNDGYGVCLDLPAFQYNEWANWNNDIGYTVSVYPDRILFTPIDFTTKTVLYGDILAVDRNTAEKKAATYDILEGTTQGDGSVLIQNTNTLPVDGIRLTATQSGNITACTVQISEDGETYIPLMSAQFAADTAAKVFFEKTTAKYFKLTVTAEGTVTAHATSYGTDMRALRSVYRTAMHYNAVNYNSEQSAKLLTALSETQTMLESRTATAEQLSAQTAKLQAAYDDRTESVTPPDPPTENNGKTDAKKSGCDSSATSTGHATAAIILCGIPLVLCRKKRNA